MNLVTIGILIIYVGHDMIPLLEFLTFDFIYPRKVVFLITAGEIEIVLRYRNIVREGET